ncbi:unnamed protein product [Mytilus edulis]|uniref:Mab-21-like HhH/H2TH-like domain-containing protein n=1 Tax=Mytilus edulis TaxID=6550 RepID=A0A8S3Q3C2_MYTED|nr:unnamed protein product [Mytilus edulis]
MLRHLPVIEDILIAKKKKWFSLLVVRELNTPFGYVKLQLVTGNGPCSHLDWPYLCFRRLDRFFKIDKSGKILLFEFLDSENDHVFKRSKNKPAEKSGNYYNLNVDMVKSYRCTTWPTMAQEWLSRHRSFGWPTPDTIRELKSLGFFVVRKGHPLSSDIDTEWRISLSLQERKLIMNLSDVQYKCYVVLKILNRDAIMLNCITSYHWKTCLFYVIEENDNNIWKKEHLFNCIQLCIVQMLKWIKCGFCPNYFIPKENFFDGKLNNSVRLLSEHILVELLNVGFDCLLFVEENNVCDYLRARGSIEWSAWLKANSAKLYDESFYIRSTSIVHVALSVFNQKYLQVIIMRQTKLLLIL